MRNSVLVSFIISVISFSFQNSIAQNSKPEFRKGKTAYYRYYAKEVKYQKEKNFCQIKFGDKFLISDQPRGTFICRYDESFNLKGEILKKVNSEFKKFEKENESKIPSEKLKDWELDSAFEKDRGISILEKSNLIKCPAGTEFSGKFYGRDNNDRSNLLDSGEASCWSKEIPMDQMCPGKGKKVQDSDGHWICGTNSCKGETVYDNERRYYICVDCPKGKPDYNESLAWRNSDDYPDKCKAYLGGPACILCRE